MEREIFQLARGYMETLLNLPVFLLSNRRQRWIEYTTGCIPSFIYSQTKSDYFWSALQKLQPHTIHSLKDDFGFNMLFTALPESLLEEAENGKIYTLDPQQPPAEAENGNPPAEAGKHNIEGGLKRTPAKCFAAYGPFMTEHADDAYCQDIIERNGINMSFVAPLKMYYDTLPVLEHTAAVSGVKVFLRALYRLPNAGHAGAEHAPDNTQAADLRITVKDLYAPDGERRAVLFPEEESSEHVLQLAYRVALENTLMDDVQAGDLEGAMETLRRLRMEVSQLVPTADPVRHQKNLSFMLNTLMRKASEAAGVAPLYFDTLFWDYAHRAERLSSATGLLELRREMVAAYVHMVRSYAVGRYSPLVQKALSYIHIHLGSRLLLGDIAGAIHISPQHLSAEFNKEVGASIPEYINQRRAEKMASMLANTNYTVAEISSFVGFADASYAARVFKGVKGVSPGEYRSGKR